MFTSSLVYVTGFYATGCVPQRDKRSLRSAQLTEKRLVTFVLAVDSDVRVFRVMRVEPWTRMC